MNLGYEWCTFLEQLHSTEFLAKQKEEGMQRARWAETRYIVVVFFPCNELDAKQIFPTFGFGNLAPVCPADAWVMRNSRECCNIFTYLYTVVEWFPPVALCLPVNLYLTVPLNTLIIILFGCSIINVVQ